MKFIECVKLAVPEAKFWILFNALGMGTYISIETWLFSSRLPEKAFDVLEQLFVWAMIQFPLLALYLGINLTWILMSRKSPCFKSRQLFVWLLGCVAWGILLLLDPIVYKVAYMLIMIESSA